MNDKNSMLRRTNILYKEGMTLLEQEAWNDRCNLHDKIKEECDARDSYIMDELGIPEFGEENEEKIDKETL